jgi:hypothetical protein
MRDALEVAVAGEEFPLDAECGCGNQGIDGSDRSPDARTGVHYAGGLDVIVLIGEQEGKQCEVRAELIELAPRPDSRQELLEHDARKRDGLMPMDQVLEHCRRGAGLAWESVRRPPKRAGPHRSVDDNQRDTRAFL